MTLAYREPFLPDSQLSRWDARWKLAALLLLGLGFALLSQPGAASVAVAIGLVLTRLGKVPLRAVRNRLALVMFAVLPPLIVLPLTTGREGAGWTVGDFFISETGLIAAGTIALRALAIGCLALVVLRTGPLPLTLAAAHALRLPGVAVQVAQLTYRYTFVFFDEIRRLRIALRTRGFRARANLGTYRTMGNAVGTLLVRGGDRAERVADAMRCRGFDGRYHALTEFRTTTVDVLGFVLCVVVAVALMLWDRCW